MEFVTTTVMRSQPISYLFLIPLSPLLGAVLCGIFGTTLQNRLGKRALHVINLGLVAAALLLELWICLGRLLLLPAGERLLVDKVFSMIHIGALRADMALALDPLAAATILIITLIGLALHWRALSRPAEGSPCRSACLNLFIFSMLLIVLGDNFIVMFMGLEGAGLTSYLLITLQRQEKTSTSEGLRTLVLNRAGSLGFLVSVMLVFWAMGGTWSTNNAAYVRELPSSLQQRLREDSRLASATVTGLPANASSSANHLLDGTVARPVIIPIGPTLSWRELKSQLALSINKTDPLQPLLQGGFLPVSIDGDPPLAIHFDGLAQKTFLGMPLLFLLCLGFFVAIIGMAAQVPLYLWLPGAALGSTSLATLANAAAMIFAALYLTIRFYFLFSFSFAALAIAAAVGLLIALLLVSSFLAKAMGRAAWAIAWFDEHVMNQVANSSRPLSRVASWLKRCCLILLAVLATQTWAPATAQAGEPAPRLEIKSRQLAFPLTGGQSTITLTNVGQAPLEIQHVRIADGAYGFSVDDFTRSLAPGDQLPITVNFYAPTRRLGLRQQVFGSLQIFTNDPRLPDDSRTPVLEHIAAVPLTVGSSWLLTAMILLPLIGMLLIVLVPASKIYLAKWLALAATTLGMALSLYLLGHFDRGFSFAAENFGLQFIEHQVLIPWLNIEYFVGVDGVSIALVLLTALLGLIAVGASWNVQKRLRGYFALLLLLEASVLGVLVALDGALFFFFWELMLLALLFLMVIWGGAGKEYAAIKFFLYMLVSSALLLLVLMAFYYHSSAGLLVSGAPAEHSFNLMRLAYVDSVHLTDANLKLMGFEFAKLCWVGLFIAFAIVMAMFPLHGWLLDALSTAPTGATLILGGVVVNAGLYGMLRISGGILPAAAQWSAGAMAALGAASVLYGIFCAVAQKDLKKFAAYALVSHTGFCLVGIAALTQSGFNGAMVQMFSGGAIMAMLLILLAIGYGRAPTSDRASLGAWAVQTPKYTAFLCLALMASAGLPGFSGFIGQVLVLSGAFPTYNLITILLAAAWIFAVAYYLWTWLPVLLGKRPGTAGAQAPQGIFADLTLREWLMLAPLGALVVFLGIYPAPLLKLIGPGLGDLLHHVTRLADASGLAMLGH